MFSKANFSHIFFIYLSCIIEFK